MQRIRCKTAGYCTESYYEYPYSTGTGTVRWVLVVPVSLWHTRFDAVSIVPGVRGTAPGGMRFPPERRRVLYRAGPGINNHELSRAVDRPCPKNELSRPLKKRV